MGMQEESVSLELQSEAVASREVMHALCKKKPQLNQLGCRERPPEELEDHVGVATRVVLAQLPPAVLRVPGLRAIGIRDSVHLYCGVR